MKIMISGGGTGGHTSPAVAVIEELRRRDPALLLQWVGRRGNIEERVSAGLGIPFRSVPIRGWPRRNLARKTWTGCLLAASIARCMLYLRKFDPQLVFGVGGYVSLPLLWAAQRLGIPTMIHEQNKRLGMANRVLALAAERVFLSYADTAGVFPEHRTRLTGNPIRSAFLHPPGREEARAAFDLDPDRPVVLVSGGSQGARTLNHAVAGLLPGIAPEQAQFIWMAGRHGAAEAHAAAESAACTVRAHSFIENMAAACAAADLIVSRAGASSTAEIAALGKPSILVPFPHAADNHQEENARAFEEAGAARVLLDGECTAPVLAATLTALLEDAALRGEMGRAALRLAHPLAAENIAEAILDHLHGGGAS